VARSLALAAAVAALLLPHTMYGSAVVVFPLDGRGVARETAESATDAVKRTLVALKGVEVIETREVEKKLGVHLIEQAHACEYDTFCLVEVGEIVGGERMLIGHVRRGGKEQKKDELELKLFVLDVAKASVVDTLIWRVKNVPGALEDAARAATKKLFAPPDATISLALTPPNAEISIFGELMPKPKAQPFPYWAGTYHVRISADGFVPQEVELEVPPGGPTTIAIELQPDLLYVAKPKDKAKSAPFDRASRREGSGVSAQEVGATAGSEVGGRRSAFANPIPWTVSGVGVAAFVVGVVLASGAQSDYNKLSGQERYTGATLPSSIAVSSRDDDRARFRTGAIVSTAGALAAAGGVAWMIVDSLVRDKAPATSDQGSVRAGVGAGFVFGEVHF
jgi:hypothetical protein